MEDEKLEIAKALFSTLNKSEKNGLKDNKIKLSDAVLKKIVSKYVKLAFVPGKTIAKVCRKMAFTKW